MPAHLKASPETCAWGYFDASLAPVLEIESGDLVVIEIVSGSPEQTPLPGLGFHIPPELLAIPQKKSPRQLAGHNLTRPVRVASAKAGKSALTSCAYTRRQTAISHFRRLCTGPSEAIAGC